MALKHILLIVIGRRPSSGYDIVKDFKEVLGFFWHAGHQQIYRELGKLDAHGLVRHTTVPQDDRPDKKVYRITDQGWEELRAWLRSPTQIRTVNDEILVKVYAGELLGCEALRRELEQDRDRHAEQLRVYREIEATYFSTPTDKEAGIFDHLVRIALRKGILSEQAWLQWTEESIATLDRLEFRP